MECDAGGVGDVGEEDVLNRRIGCLQNLRHERGPQRLAFTVDVGVVGAREVDALEGTRPYL